MNTDRIREIQSETAYPDSRSVKAALLQVWNECGHELAAKDTRIKELEETVRLSVEKLELEAETIRLNHEASKRDWAEISDLKAKLLKG